MNFEIFGYRDFDFFFSVGYSDQDAFYLHRSIDHTKHKSIIPYHTIFPAVSLVDNVDLFDLF